MGREQGVASIPAPRRCACPAAPPMVGPVATRDDDQTVALVALLRARINKMTWAEIASEIAIRGEAASLWSEHYPDGLYGPTDPDGHWARATAEVAAWRAADYDLRTVLEPTYPTALREIHQMPPILFSRGAADLERRGVSVVGSRAASPRGLRTAALLAEGLVDRGLPVLSGLADGIDRAAHLATLEAGGTPIGVLGTGITKTYPAVNKDLHAQVAEYGALVSQFLPDAPPNKSTFPMRNAIMSGLGRATIVVEAGEHSGARIQARVAAEHGRPVILTDLVVQATDWGKYLLGRPGVFHARSIAEALEQVDSVLDPVETLLALAL
jgi:DNA processing protein